MNAKFLGRRDFNGLLASSLLFPSLTESRAGELPTVDRPRATDGDDRHEPDWKNRLTITVGEKSGDLVGNDDKALQAAIAYVSRLGGGTVKILPGTYRLRNAVHLESKVRLLGSGEDSVITKIPSQS